MFVVMLKSIITFLVVFFVIRLMGKRQIGEMQPFELVITLIIAEVACIPMNDPYIPLYSGIVPIVTLATLHIVLSFASRKSLKLRKVLSGSSIIVVNPDGIIYENLQKMNMNMDDLIEALRTAGYVDITQVAYAIFETNGKLCVVEKEQPQQQSESQSQSDSESEKQEQQTKTLLPLQIVVDGRINAENIELSGTSKSELESKLKEKNLKISDLLYADVRQDGNAYFSPKKAKAFSMPLNISGGNNW